LCGGGGSAGGRGIVSTSMWGEVMAGLVGVAGVGWQSRRETEGMAVVSVDRVGWVVALVGLVVNGI